MEKLALLLTCLVLFPTASHAQESIRFAVNDWAGQHISTRIMGEALSRKGFRVSYVDTQYEEDLHLIGTGKIDVAMEIWSTTLKQPFEKAVADGTVVNLGETGMTAIENWWYPAYMEDQCPGLPDWTALKTCAEAFATDATKPKGFYLGGPADWGGFDEERIEALELPFEMRHARDVEELTTTLQKAYEDKAPVMLWVYSPNFTEALYEGSWVAFPAYEDACYDDPSWGVNPKLAYDCGKPTGPIFKAGSQRLAGTWPAAEAAIRKFRITNEEMAALDAKVATGGMSVETVVEDWLEENNGRWSAWFE
ncbi:ABC transporter substrate-binding protein [Hoeflea sp.]|uniref:ABC transporter substrate-binding protein n=1 Tax=Hoeflea sp. TaxID=1940281 RepID=UPI003B01E476